MMRSKLNALPALFIAGLLLLSSCRSTNDTSRVFHLWGWDDAEDAKLHLDNYKDVLIVRVDKWRRENVGSHKLAPLHFEATVIKSYRGDWAVGEKIGIVHYLDGTPPESAHLKRQGDLMFVFTNEHISTEIAVDTGEFGIFNAKYAPALDSIFSAGK